MYGTGVFSSTRGPAPADAQSPVRPESYLNSRFFPNSPEHRTAYDQQPQQPRSAYVSLQTGRPATAGYGSPMRDVAGAQMPAAPRTPSGPRAPPQASIYDTYASPLQAQPQALQQLQQVQQQQPPATPQQATYGAYPSVPKAFASPSAPPLASPQIPVYGDLSAPAVAAQDEGECDPDKIVIAFGVSVQMHADVLRVLSRAGAITSLREGPASSNFFVCSFSTPQEAQGALRLSGTVVSGQFLGVVPYTRVAADVRHLMGAPQLQVSQGLMSQAPPPARSIGFLSPSAGVFRGQQQQQQQAAAVLGPRPVGVDESDAAGLMETQQGQWWGTKLVNSILGI
eukprot:m51a1_g14588 hypothetical protein (340) ;mRNA; r:1145308-1147084